MFEFLFKYPLAAFQKGELVLLGAGPSWLLVVLILLVAVGLAVLVGARARRARASSPVGTGADGSTGRHNVRLGVIWSLEALTAAVLLVLLWQPALVVTELEP